MDKVSIIPIESPVSHCFLITITAEVGLEMEEEEDRDNGCDSRINWRRVFHMKWAEWKKVWGICVKLTNYTEEDGTAG